MAAAKSKPVAPPQAGGWRHKFWHPRIIIILILLCTLPMLRNILKKSEQQILEQEQYLVQRAEVSLKDRPEFVPKELLDRVWQQAEIPEQFSILEAGLAEKLGKAMELSPWVRSVKEVKLTYPKTIEISLEYRRPVALVRSAEGYYPIDRDGILLPPADFSAAQLPQYPIIENVETLPQGAAGSHWGDLAVWGAGRLVEMLTPEGDQQRYWKKYQLASVRVQGRADLDQSTAEHLHQISYRLVTREGSEVIWGVAPEVPDPTEPDAETKLKRLEIYYRDFGGLKSEQGPVEIDLRRWKDIARRTLEEIRR